MRSGGVGVGREWLGLGEWSALSQGSPRALAESLVVAFRVLKCGNGTQNAFSGLNQADFLKNELTSRRPDDVTLSSANHV